MQCPICKSVGLPYDMFRDMCSSCSRAQQRMEAQVDTIEQVFKERVARMTTKDTNPKDATKDTNPKDAIGDTKAPLWLLSPIAKVKWAMAQFAGQIKYGSWNWRAAGVRTSVYLSAMERHMEAYKSGEDLDPVDGTHHLGNVMACCAILMDAAAAHKLTDDRPPRVDHRPTIAEAEALMAKLKVQYADRNPRHYTIADSVAPATLPPSTEGENHVTAAQPVQTNGHPDATRREGRAPGTEEA